MRHLLIVPAVLLGLVSFTAAQISYQGYADPMDLVDHWYQTFLGRSARSDQGSYSWANQLRGGAAPNAVLAGILSSDEYYAKGGNTPEGFIRNLFADIVVRQPTPQELQYWMQRTLTENIADPRTRQEIAYDILTNNPGSASGSYVVPPLPRERFDRDKDRERERQREKEKERDQYDYRRPPYPYRH